MVIRGGPLVRDDIGTPMATATTSSRPGRKRITCLIIETTKLTSHRRRMPGAELRETQTRRVFCDSA